MLLAIILIFLFAATLLGSVMYSGSAPMAQAFIVTAAVLLFVDFGLFLLWLIDTLC